MKDRIDALALPHLTASRRVARRILGRLEINSTRRLLTALAVAVAAAAIAFVPDYAGLTIPAQRTLFILLLAAGLWATEAVPAYAVGILVIALEILLLARPGSPYAHTANDWERWVLIWGHPLIWLFFGGFVLAAGTAKSGLDRWLAIKLLAHCGRGPGTLLLGVMSFSFVASMFLSNTATTAMMLAVMTPLVGAMNPKNPYRRGLLLGVPFAANLGGMGTIVGTPPNAIAVGALDAVAGQSVSFLGWMGYALPPALVLFGVLFFYLRWAYPASSQFQENLSRIRGEFENAAAGLKAPLWQRLLVLAVFLSTIALWMSGHVHHLPTAVVSFLPLVAFTITGIIDIEDVRSLAWDVLLLIAGGLALGEAVRSTGLADWLVGGLPLGAMSGTLIVLVMAYVCMVLSNFMSNTAASNLLIPLGLAMMAGAEREIALAVAMAASAAMCLPISTPPNAIIYSIGIVRTKDMMRGGLVIGVLAPLVAVFWIGFLRG
jgi:sodium-dependent dicarboxylate transporter 2/3/5